MIALYTQVALAGSCYVMTGSVQMARGVLMIKKGSLVRYTGRETKDLWPGVYLSVAERCEDRVEVYRKDKKDNWVTTTLKIADVEEVC